MQQDTDCLRRFIFDGRAVRGEWVRLTQSWHEINSHAEYPAVVKQQLGQALAAAVLLSATVKFKGSLILQVQGDGPLRTLVAQATHDRNIRGLARHAQLVPNGELQNIYGHGHLVLTIQSENAEPYQGVVELTGESLAGALENYFIRSEQLRTRLWLYADDTQAVGLFLQELPAQRHADDDWETLQALAHTVTETELRELLSEELLARLFHEESVRLFDAEPVAFKCSCSSGKIENTLLGLGSETLQEMLRKQDVIEIICEFCNRNYRFNKQAVNRLIEMAQAPFQSSTRH